jgi:hypothetical protein
MYKRFAGPLMRDGFINKRTKTHNTQVNAKDCCCDPNNYSLDKMKFLRQSVRALSEQLERNYGIVVDTRNWYEIFLNLRKVLLL